MTSEDWHLAIVLGVWLTAHLYMDYCFWNQLTGRRKKQ